MENIEIREIAAEDAGELIDYLKRIGSETDNLTFGKEGLPVTVEQEREYLQQVHDAERSVYYGVWKDGMLTGEGSLSGLPRRMSHCAELGLTVVKAEWNKGIGSLLLDKLIGYARRSGMEMVILDVRSDNTGAIHLYEKYGFQHAGTTPAYFKIGNEYFDMERMYLDLR